MYSKFGRGAPLLSGNATVPGQHLTEIEKDLFSKILVACREAGADFYPTIIQKLTYDEMSEIVAYNGFPNRYPHWRFGMAYEEFHKGYEYGMQRVFEIVINTSPCVMYLLNSNTLLDNATVVAHATFHNDFFKNNIVFKPTNTGMMNKMANHGNRIRKYIDRYGAETVFEFIDNILAIETLIDPVKIWDERQIQEPIIQDKKEYELPRRVMVPVGHDYMEPYFNTKEFKEKEDERIKHIDKIKDLGIFAEPEKDIFGFIKNYAPLKPWQADIASMLYDEALYFSPQGMTKTINEGFASYGDFDMMCRRGWADMIGTNYGCGIIEYAKHKMMVLGDKYGANPYRLGFQLLMDIEDRWDKGKFGDEWENCRDLNKKENWDEKLGKGREKVFEVRKYYDDVMLINEFFTQDFCQKYEFFEWKRQPNGDHVIENRGDTPESFKKIKNNLVRSKLNRGLPDIRLTDPNHRNKGWMLLQHVWDGRMLEERYTRETMTALYSLWGSEIVLASRNYGGDEVVFLCVGKDADKDTVVMKRLEYDDYK